MVTGQPGSGKTTFAKELSDKLYMPLISRDHIKEGYVHTFGKKHTELPPETNKIATEIFFDTLMGLMQNNVSVIAEAAFQHEIWSSMLKRFMEIEKIRLYLLICKIDGKLALERFINRGLNNEMREYFHGDKGVDMARKGLEVGISPYNEPKLNVPTFHIDTTGEYNPSIDELRRAIFDA